MDDCLPRRTLEARGPVSQVEECAVRVTAVPLPPEARVTRFERRLVVDGRAGAIKVAREAPRVLP